jgi:hypothetical protein
MKSGMDALKATLNRVKLSGHNPEFLYLFSLSSPLILLFGFLVVFFNGKTIYLFLLYRALPQYYLPNIPAHFLSNLLFSYHMFFYLSDLSAAMVSDLLPCNTAGFHLINSLSCIALTGVAHENGTNDLLSRYASR